MMVIILAWFAFVKNYILFRKKNFCVSFAIGVWKITN